MPSMSYYEVLDQTHRTLQPRTYLEIGIRHGDATVFALPGTKVVAVDPFPNVLQPLPEGTIVERTTSDEFFEEGRAAEHFGGEPVDMSFIDGMHLVEYALRDILNTERVSHAGSVIFLHDCLPPSAEVAERDRTTVGWTGDVWKILPYLRDNRPDLDICVFDASPTGLGVIQNLDPSRDPIDIEAALADYRDSTYESFVADVRPGLEVITGGWDAMRIRLPQAPWQELNDIEQLVAARDRRRPSMATRGRRLKRRVLRTSVGAWASRLRLRVLRRN